MVPAQYVATQGVPQPGPQVTPGGPTAIPPQSGGVVPVQPQVVPPPPMPLPPAPSPQQQSSQTAPKHLHPVVVDAKGQPSGPTPSAIPSQMVNVMGGGPPPPQPGAGGVVPPPPQGAVVQIPGAGPMGQAPIPIHMVPPPPQHTMAHTQHQPRRSLDGGARYVGQPHHHNRYPATGPSPYQSPYVQPGVQQYPGMPGAPMYLAPPQRYDHAIERLLKA